MGLAGFAKQFQFLETAALWLVFGTLFRKRSPQTRLRTRPWWNNGHRGTFVAAPWQISKALCFIVFHRNTPSKNALRTRPERTKLAAVKLQSVFLWISCCGLVAVHPPRREPPNIEQEICFSARSQATNTILSCFATLHASAWQNASWVRLTNENADLNARTWVGASFLDTLVETRTRSSRHLAIPDQRKSSNINNNQQTINEQSTKIIKKKKTHTHCTEKHMGANRQHSVARKNCPLYAPSLVSKCEGLGALWAGRSTLTQG